MSSLPQHHVGNQSLVRAAKLAVVIYAGLCGPNSSRAADPFLRIPQADRAVLHQVAAEYRLTAEQRRLLFAIRIVEWGGPGREMGVLHPHAMRFAKDPRQSLLTQARWAAGTIRRRYNGDLAEFARRWCPLTDSRDKRNLNKNWLPNVRRLMAGR